MFVALAIFLRCKPEALTSVLPTLREDPKYQGHDKLPLTVWMIAQVRGGLGPRLSNSVCVFVKRLFELLRMFWTGRQR